MTGKSSSIRIAACIFGTLIAVPVLAGPAAESVSVNDPYVRIVPPGMTTTGAFMVLKNADTKDHQLVKAESSAAKVTELHTHTMDGGVMKMRPVKEIGIKAKGEAELKPGGFHVMMIGLKQELKEGDKVAVTLTFEDGSSKKVEVPARKIQTEMQMKMKPETMHDHMNMH